MSKVIPLSSHTRAFDFASRKPEWLKVKAPGSPSYLRLKGLMRDLNLHTVCEEARCPNIGECWTHGTATFMILGDICTRACGYCAVGHGRPHAVDTAEPARVADAVATLDLAHVVVTSVDRDDVPDGGASIFAETIREIRRRTPGASIEVLIPDFQGKAEPLYTVLDAGPDILNHNTETVPRLYRLARSGGRYERTLRAARSLARLRAAHRHEIGHHARARRRVGRNRRHAARSASGGLRDSHAGPVPPSVAGSPAHDALLPSRRVRRLKDIALEMGFAHVESGPLVRSSYHAHEQADALLAGRR